MPVGVTESVAHALALVPAEWVDRQYAAFLFAGILLAGVGTLVVFLLGVAAYARRRAFHYLLITLALGALVVRTGVGLATVYGLVPMTIHHLLGHALDFLVAALVLYAVYSTR
ncbi:hypothetical protein DVK02_11605 [Halobellus sp. Atlit-31R]|nr:hypothetical protein DVK02_11605 [Halobellus sp. Atlit-31R]